MATHRASRRADLPLEVGLLLIGGLAMLITGGLLLPVSAGALPYYEGGLYGLLLVVFALQTVTLGKTPFGDTRRTTPVIAAGAAVAAIGIVTCFVPDLLGDVPRMLLVVSFGLGGLTLLLRGLLARDRFRVWWGEGGVLRHLVVSAGSVYAGSVVVALLLGWPGMLTAPATAVVVVGYGAVIVYLAVVLRAVYRRHPQAESAVPGGAGLTTEHAMLLLMGIFMLLLGATLVPVNFGALPFSGSAQLGLLMVFFAVQMLASGSTPIGVFPRTWGMVAAALVFAAAGIVSAIVPDVLVVALTVLVGVLNILSGLLTLGRQAAPLRAAYERPRESVTPTAVKLFVVQVVMGLVAVLFGASMLVVQLVPGLVLGVVLAANGAVLLYELHLLRSMDRDQRAGLPTPVAAPVTAPATAPAAGTATAPAAGTAGPAVSRRGRPTGASPAA